MKARLRLLSLATIGVACAFAAGCGGSSSSPAAPAAVAGDGIPVSASARLGWTQPAGSLAEVSTYSFVAYVDGANRLTLNTPQCQQSATSGAFDCLGSLPKLSTGRHVIELAAVNANGDEGPRSPSLVVSVQSS